MTTPLVCLMIVALLPYLCAWTGAYYKVRQFGSLDNKTPRQQTAKLEGAGARVAAAQANAWEALPLFTAAVVASQLGHAEPGRAAWLSELFVVTRVLHPIFYVSDQDKLRSLVFLVGLFCIVGLFVSAF